MGECTNRKEISTLDKLIVTTNVIVANNTNVLKVGVVGGISPIVIKIDGIVTIPVNGFITNLPSGLNTLVVSDASNQSVTVIVDIPELSSTLCKKIISYVLDSSPYNCDEICSATTLTELQFIYTQNDIKIDSKLYRDTTNSASKSKCESKTTSWPADSRFSKIKYNNICYGVNTSGVVTGVTDCSVVSTIGQGVWAKSNLDVVQFRNGDSLTEITKVEDIKYDVPSYIRYEFNNSYGVKYGYLYNYAAISDTRILAPIGYKIPSMDDWRNLFTNITNAGKLKSKTDWIPPNTGAENLYNFGILGGGQYNGKEFVDLDKSGYYWTSDATFSYPASSDVVLNTAYNNNSLTGSVVLPPVSSVVLGCPVGISVGTATPLTIDDFLNTNINSLTASNSIGRRLKNISTTNALSSIVKSLVFD